MSGLRHIEYCKGAQLEENRKAKGDFMIEPLKPPKKDRKQRIKNENANRKRVRIPLEPKTPEDLQRRMMGWVMVAFGLLKVAGIDPARLIEKTDELPSEIDLDGPIQEVEK